MARRAVLAGGSLNPFGGGQVDFGAFNIGASPSQTKSDAEAAADRAAQLALNSQEIQWNAGQISNAAYLAALQAYAGTVDSSTTTGQNAIARVATYEYRFQRDAIAGAVEDGSAPIESLLAYDRSMLSGVDQGSEEYRQRLNYLQSDQGTLYSQRASALVDEFNAGRMTTAQLNDAYVQLGNSPELNDNRQIRADVDKQLSNLADRVQTELDNQTLSDYQKGRISPAQFMTYGAAARSRYVPGSAQYQDWTQRLTDANDQAKETGLLYRYDLTQQMIGLEKFIQSSGAPKGGTSTSKRTVLGADGAWHVVETTKATAPSASEVAAYAARQAQVQSAKDQLARLQAKIATVGGIVSTDTTLHYYQNQLAKVALGSDEWYQIQGKIDSLNDNKAAETLLSSQGIRISYPPKPGAATAGAGSAAPGTTAKGGVKAAVSTSATSGEGSAVSLSAFMTAIAHQESGGRYTATNKSSGAYGKYQIMPANWGGWAKQYLGDANAPQTPENQEKVAEGKMGDLYKWLGDWRAVAAWWVAGGGKAAANPSSWSPATTHYVDNVMAGLGKGPTSASPFAAAAKVSGQSAVPTGGAKPMTKPTAKPAASSGPLRIITGVDQRSGEPKLTAAGLPVGLDGAAFAKFYSQYSAAFASGATEFTIATPGGNVHYWIGDDAVERQALMRQVDALQIGKARVELEAYAGTDSAQIKANAYDTAVSAGARHELIILDQNTGPTDKAGTPTPYSSPGGTVVQDLNRGAAPRIDQKTGQVLQNTANPLAQGLHVLDVANTAIADFVRLGDAAYKAGNLTKAYSFYQLADARRQEADKAIIPFVLGAQQGMAAIEQTYGVSASEALDQAGYGTLSKDLERLNSFGPELDAAVNKGVPNLTELLQVVRKNADGSPKFDSEGPGGQISLDPHYHYEVNATGQVSIQKTQISGVDSASGKKMTKIPGMANVDYLVGTNTINAFVKYQTTTSDQGTGGIGWLITASGERIALDGKFYTRQRADGTDETVYEDPFSGKWSTTPVVYKAPPGFQSITVGGKHVLQFGGSPDPLPPGQVRSDYTYSMTFDPATGTYTATRSKPGSFLTAEVKDEELGSVRPGTEVGDIFTGSGFKRDLSGLTGDDRLMANLDAPFIGGTAAQYSQWKNSGIMTAFKPVSEWAQIQAEKALIRQSQPVPTLRTPTVNAQAGFVTSGLAPAINAQTGFKTGVTTLKPLAPLTAQIAPGVPVSVPVAKPAAKTPPKTTQIAPGVPVSVPKTLTPLPITPTPKSTGLTPQEFAAKYG